jgi:predicted DNA binding CopG/RHH family protein
MPLTDLQAAQEMAREKGLPYQTYMKMLLHQALEKERRAS